MSIKDMDIPQTLQDALIYFNDSQACFDFVVQMRWADGVVCPRCGCEEHSFLKTRKIWTCKGCHKQFSVKVGTIMEDSSLSLSKWLAAIWLITNAKNGISSYELHRAIGVTQKTAWFMLQRIRHMLESGSIEKMTGECEIDETYIGGEAKNMHLEKRAEKIQGRGSVGKTAVLGFLNRGERKTKEQHKKKQGKHSTVHAKVIKTIKGDTLKNEVRQYIQTGATLYTDQLRSYKGLFEYVHNVINHSREYVCGHIHTNGIENFWSLFKRCIKGTYISIDPIHLNRYVAEQVFRFNERELGDRGRFMSATKKLAGKRLTYQQLIGC